MKKLTLEGGLLTACLLLLGVAQTKAQQITAYVDQYSPTTLETLATDSDYNSFIVGFVYPVSSTNPALQYDSEQGMTANQLEAAYVPVINQTESDGKDVLLSFGGSTVSDAEYEQYASNPAELATILTAYVNGTTYTVNGTTYDTYDGEGVAGQPVFNGYSGIDLDFEDTQAFTPSQTYNGVSFISALTSDLATDLPGKIITEAPQTVYLDPTFTQNGGPYATAAGNTPGGAYQAILTPTIQGDISYLNVQVYNNSPDDGSGIDPLTGKPATDPVTGIADAFIYLVENNPSLALNQDLHLTLPIHTDNAGTNNNLTDAQITEIVQKINAYLVANGYPELGGVTGFQLYSTTDPTLTDDIGFAQAVDEAYAVPEPSTFALLALGALGIFWRLRRRAAAAR